MLTLVVAFAIASAPPAPPPAAPPAATPPAVTPPPAAPPATATQPPAKAATSAPMEIDIGAAVTTEAPPNPLHAGPKIIVPQPTKAGVPVVAAHRPLVEALQAVFGPRVVSAKDVLDAQIATGLTASDLKPPPVPQDAARSGPPPPPGLARLGEQLGALRAIFVEISPKETRALVYPTLEGAPAVVVTVPKKKADATNAKWAGVIAAEIARLAAGALEDPPQEVVIEEPVSDVRSEIAAEEARDRARRAELMARQRAVEDAQDPLVSALVGTGGAWRVFEVGGAGAAALATVQNGTVPVASVFLSASPLKAIPGLRASPWTDVLLEVAYRRGFADVRSGDEACPYDDDDLQARASYRVVFGSSPWLPRVGLGGGGGIERVELGCALPAISTRYPNAAGFVRITQPLLPRTADGPASPLELDVLGGGRAIFTDDEGTVAPSLAAEAFVVWRPLRFVVARAGTRVTNAHLESGAGPSALIVDDTRASFELQLGGSF